MIERTALHNHATRYCKRCRRRSTFWRVGMNTLKCIDCHQEVNDRAETGRQRGLGLGLG
ncbi:MAG: hypothetical protein ACYTDX_10590 [Planctomycetota bacterium]|jgi:hypothetical protein